MTKAYKFSILYFLLFSFLLMATAVMLFEHKIGFSKLEVLQYYLGNKESFMIAKSPLGLLKIILPHIFAFGLFMMVILHFLAFTEHKNTKKLPYIIYGSYISAFTELFAPFLIIGGFEFFAYIKITAFFSLFGLQTYVSWLLYSSIMKG
ncbi:MAG: hypothetical protein U9N39_09500 [Campylobacterota bacterium]|nr:hypothetical protein [Campylobacterota bacterium]